MKKSVIKSAGIFIFAAFFRFYDLGVSPYWIDEVLLLHKVSGDVSLVQTIPYVFILRIMPFELTEFWVRFPSALFGSFMPVVFYLVFRQKNERLALAFSLVIAVFPLFVFWSRYARPYMMAGFFIICSWGNRDIYKLFLIPAVLLTPLAIIGLKPSLNKRVILYYMVLIGGIFIMLKIRPDGDRNFLSEEFLFNAKRIWVLGISGGFCYLFRVVQYGYHNVQSWKV